MVTRINKNPRLIKRTGYQPIGRGRIPLPRPGRKTPLRPRGFRRLWVGLTLAELFMEDPEGQGNQLERMVDGVAHELGIVWDGKQVDLPLTLSGRYTRVDRVLQVGSQIMLVYIDGPQHVFRPNQVQADLMQDMELQSQGYLVVRLKYDDLMLDPISTVRQGVLARMWI